MSGVGIATTVLSIVLSTHLQYEYVFQQFKIDWLDIKIKRSIRI